MRIVVRYLLAAVLGLVVGLALEVGACFGSAFVYHAESFALLEEDYSKNCRMLLKPEDYLQGLSLMHVGFVLRWLAFEDPSRGGLLLAPVIAALGICAMQDRKRRQSKQAQSTQRATPPAKTGPSIV